MMKMKARRMENSLFLNFTFFDRMSWHSITNVCRKGPPKGSKINKRILLLTAILSMTLFACLSDAEIEPNPPVKPTSVVTLTPALPLRISETSYLGKGSAEDIAWTADGKQLIIAGSMGLHYYEPNTGDFVRHVETPTDPDYAFPSSVELSPDGTKTLFAGMGGIWMTDLTESKTARFLKDWAYSNSRAIYSRDGKKIVYLRYTIAADGYADFWGVQILDANSGENLVTLFDSETVEIYAVKISPDGHTIAIARGDNFIHLFDMNTGKNLGILQGHESDVLDFDFSPDGKFATSVGADATLRIWDMQTQHLIQTERGFTKNLQIVTYAPDGKQLFALQEDGTLRHWSIDADGLIAAGDVLRVFHAPVKRMLVQPDGALLAVLQKNGRIEIVDWKTGRIINSLLEFGANAKQLSWSSDGTLLAAASGDCYFNDGVLFIWDIIKKQLRERLETNGICDVAFSPDGTQLAYLESDKDLIIWDLKSHQEVNSIETTVYSYSENRIAFSPDGEYIATAGSTLQVWDIRAATLISETDVKDSAAALSFSPDGKRLALVTSLNILMFDAFTGVPISSWDLKIDGNNFSYIRSSYVKWDTGEPFVALSDGINSYFFWSLNDGRLLYQIKKDPRMNGGFALSPDARLLAAESSVAGGIFDAYSGLTLWSSDQVPWNLTSFSPDGKTLAVIGYGNTIHLWDVSQAVETASRIPAATATMPIPQYTATPSPTQPAPVVMASLVAPTTEPGALQGHNIQSLHEVTRLNDEQGILFNAVLAPGGKFFAVNTSLGVHVYSTKPFLETGFVSMQGKVPPPAVSPDGTLLLTDDLVLWDVVSGKPLHTLSFSAQDQKKKINPFMPKMSFSPNGQWIDVEFQEGILCTWKITNEQSTTCKNIRVKDMEFMPLAISPDGRMAAFYGDQNSLLVKNVASGEVLHTFEYKDNWVSDVLFSPDGHALAFSSYQGNTSYSGITTTGEGRIEIWEFDEDCHFVFKHALEIGKWHFSAFQQNSLVHFTEDGDQIIVMNGGAEIQFWDVQTGRKRYVIRDAGSWFTLDSAGEWILTSDERSSVKLWKSSKNATPALVDVLDGFTDTPEYLSVAENGQLFAAGRWRGQLWDMDEKNVARVFEGNSSPFVFSRDGKLLAAQSQNGFVEVLDAQTGRILKSFQAVMFAEIGDPRINSLSLSVDGTKLATIGSDWKIRLWDWRDARVIWEWDNYEFRVEHLTFNADGSYLAASGNEYNYGNDIAHTGVTIWDTRTGEQARQFDMAGSHIAFHPNGVQLFSVRGDGQFQLFDLPSGRIVWTVQGISEARGIAISPDGKFLVAVNSWTVQVLATESGNVLYEMKTDIQPISLAFSMDGKLLAIGCGDGTIHIFQAK